MSEPWPLYDLFLDLPHPAGSPSCPPPSVIASSPHGEVQQELGTPESIGRIARFAFPEFDDQLPPPPTPPPESPGLNRYDVYTTKGFLRHTFSLQLSNGQRVHGHVRRFLPTHEKAKSRYDVGRRGVRALVLLTRASAGDSTYAALLKTVEAIAALHRTTSAKEAQEAFLTNAYQLHVRYYQFYAQKPDDERRPMLMTVEGVEFQSPKLKGVDTSRFLLPVSLLQPRNDVSSISSMNESPILPVLRCLGVPNTMRLLSALLSDSRVLLISNSPARLAACARSALGMLAQGQLHWQHLFIPVLPPHLFQYLQAPMPYLVGMLASNMAKLDSMRDLGEMMLIHLDQNELETRGIPGNQVALKIPDLLASEADPSLGQYSEMSPSDYLAQDLVELMKADKRAMTGGETGVQETAAQTVKAVKSTFAKLKKRGKDYLRQQSGGADFPYDASPGTPQEQSSGTTTPSNMEDDIYVEGVQNDVGEEEARIAFAMFFLCAYGDMRWYLMPGPTPQLDRERFLQQKRNIDGGNLFPLYQNLVQSQMFEQFVKDRVEEIRIRMPVSKDSPLFAVCANYHRKNQIDFSVASVRRVARQVAQANPGRLVSQANANARRLAMALTSNAMFEGNYNQAIAQLVEMAHETTSVLCEVMSVIWMRLRDSRGMQWKHALYALQILRNLLFHGPLAAITEATDGLDRIRKFKAYTDTMRAQNYRQIQIAATEVYNLLVDRAKLFSIRRVCADRRREMKNPPQGSLPKETGMRIGIPFRNIHAALNPKNRREVAPDPGNYPAQQNAAPAQTRDLLGFDSPVSAPVPAGQETTVSQVMGLFDSQAKITPTTPSKSPGRGAPIHPQLPSSPAPRDPFAPPTATQPQATPPPSHQAAVNPFVPTNTTSQRTTIPQQQQRPAPSQVMDPFAPIPAQHHPPQQTVPQQHAMDPFAPVPQLQPTIARLPPHQQQQQPSLGPPPPQQQNRAGPFGGQVPGTPQQQQQQFPGVLQQQPRPGMPQQGYPAQGGVPSNMMQPPQYQQQPNGYPGHQFGALPPQQPQQPPKKNISQFDPMAR
jgi:hypothetical protein